MESFTGANYNVGTTYNQESGSKSLDQVSSVHVRAVGTITYLGVSYNTGS